MLSQTTPTYYQAVAVALEAGPVFQLYYSNYSSYMSAAQGLPKWGTSRFNLSTQSLDMVIINPCWEYHFNNGVYIKNSFPKYEPIYYPY